MEEIGLFVMLLVGGFIFIPLLLGLLIGLVLVYWSGMSMSLVFPVIITVAFFLWLIIVATYKV